MNEQIEVLSIEKIEAFAATLRIFAARGLPLARSAGSHIARGQAFLADRRLQCRHKVERLEDAVRQAKPDEDISGIFRLLNRAQEEYHELLRCESLIDQKVSIYERAEHALSGLLQDGTAAASASLKNIVTALQDYNSIRIEDSLGGGTRNVSESANSSTTSAHSASSPSLGSLSTFPLPCNFAWVSLKEIDLSNEMAGLKKEDDFREVPYPYTQLKEAALLFKDRVLPELTNGGQAMTSEYWAEIDRHSGLNYESGVQRAFEAFLAPGECIKLSRGKDQPLYSITSGRHRIKMALDLGWEHVPVFTGKRIP